MTYEESQELIKCKKYIKFTDDSKEYNLDHTYLDKTIDLESPDFSGFFFKLSIKNSKKSTLKLSLHVFRNKDKMGLCRVDFFGTHKNPTEINEKVPEILQKYKAKWFDYSEHHIHFQVDGYNSLAWAMPLIDFEDLKYEDIGSREDFYGFIINFCKFINIQNKIILPETKELF